MAWGLSLALLVALAGLLAGAMLWGVYAVRTATHPPRYRLDLTPADLHLPSESLTITTADGVRLAGWLLIPPAPRGLILVQHGYGTCRADPLQLIALVFRGGYAVLSVDFRGHGESAGACTFGRDEPRDVRAMIEWATGDPRLRALPIGYFGISMGAAIGILTAAEEPRIRAIVSDSSYARVWPMVGRYQRLSYGLPEIPFGWVTGVCLTVALGTSLFALDPVRAARRLNCPLLIIHGGEDQSIPVRHARELYAASAGSRDLWIVPGASHVASIEYAPAAYAERVLAFFNRYLTHA